MTGYSTLIDSSALSNLANSVKILDCRAALGDREAGYRAFQQSHIPGAQYLNLDEDLAGPPGDKGRHPLPDPEQLAARLRTLGISDNDQVAVYDDAGGAYAGTVSAHSVAEALADGEHDATQVGQVTDLPPALRSVDPLDFALQVLDDVGRVGAQIEQAAGALHGIEHGAGLHAHQVQGHRPAVGCAQLDGAMAAARCHGTQVAAGRDPLHAGRRPPR